MESIANDQIKHYPKNKPTEPAPNCVMVPPMITETKYIGPWG